MAAHGEAAGRRRAPRLGESRWIPAAALVGLIVARAVNTFT